MGNELADDDKRAAEEKRISELSFCKTTCEIVVSLKKGLGSLPNKLLFAMTEEKSSARTATSAFVMLLILILVAWGGSAFAIRYLAGSTSMAGSVGDLFGAVNALFSGIALAGVIIAIILQTAELREQRKEIDDSQKIAQQTADENAKTAEQLLLTGYVNAAVALLNSPKLMSVEQEKQIYRIKAALKKTDQDTKQLLDIEGIPDTKSLLLSRIAQLTRIVKRINLPAFEMDEAAYATLVMHIKQLWEFYDMFSMELPVFSHLRFDEHINSVEANARTLYEMWKEFKRTDHELHEFFSSPTYTDKYLPLSSELLRNVHELEQDLVMLENGVRDYQFSD